MDFERLKEEIKRDKNGLFFAFKEMLKEKNKVCNLTSVCDDEGIFYRHFLDSAAGEEFFPVDSLAVEIGSGGGFPSIPLKILRPDLKFTLIESTGKKCAFLNDVISKLNLKDMRVLNIRAEDGAKTALRESFDIACARAVAPLNSLAEYCLPYVKTGGRFIAYKGDCAAELKEAKRAIKTLGGEVEKVVSFDLENCGKRSLVIVKKVCATPQKYPRGNGKERKNPIV